MSVRSHTSKVALLLIDFINDFDFEGGEQLADKAIAAARRTALLRRRARRSHASVIYINDNFKQWRSDFRAVIRHCERRSAAAKAIVRLLKPRLDDYFVLKPKNSGFFQSPLGLLLQHLGVNKLILAGLTTDNCVLFTANDAHLRDLKIIVAEDCTAAIDDRDAAHALRYMRNNLDAQIIRSTDFKFVSTKRAPRNRTRAAKARR